jgi:hypothetical protein
MIIEKLEEKICPKGQTKILIVRNGFPVSRKTARRLENMGYCISYVETPNEARKISRNYDAVVYNTKSGIPFLKPDTNI